MFHYYQVFSLVYVLFLHYFKIVSILYIQFWLHVDICLNIVNKTDVENSTQTLTKSLINSNLIPCE